MAKHPVRITWRILLQHVQTMGNGLTKRMDDMENRIMNRFAKVDSRFAHVDSRMDRLENKMDRIHMNLSGQIDAIDQRLDDVEVVQVPKLKKAVGMR